jgi:hypothetical protein
VVRAILDTITHKLPRMSQIGSAPTKNIFVTALFTRSLKTLPSTNSISQLYQRPKSLNASSATLIFWLLMNVSLANTANFLTK